MIEQSPINVDTTILTDLAADYTAKLDLSVLANTAANATGVLAAAGTNAVTYTSATPTVSGLYSKIADRMQRTFTSRYLGPDAIVMHPRRWAWITAASDSSSRPLVVPSGQGSFNALGTSQIGDIATGPAGSLLGLPVYLDPNIPTNFGAGTNQDPITVGRFADAVLYEGTLNMESFRDLKADLLAAYIRVYAYSAFSFARYPASFTVIIGSGQVTRQF